MLLVSLSSEMGKFSVAGYAVTSARVPASLPFRTATLGRWRGPTEPEVVGGRAALPHAEVGTGPQAGRPSPAASCRSPSHGRKVVTACRWDRQVLAGTESVTPMGTLFLSAPTGRDFQPRIATHDKALRLNTPGDVERIKI